MAVTVRYRVTKITSTLKHKGWEPEDDGALSKRELTSNRVTLSLVETKGEGYVSSTTGPEAEIELPQVMQDAGDFFVLGQHYDVEIKKAS